MTDTEKVMRNTIKQVLEDFNDDNVVLDLAQSALLEALYDVILDSLEEEDEEDDNDD